MVSRSKKLYIDLIGGSQTLKSLGKYCSNNEGELLVVLGDSIVLFFKDCFHKNGLSQGPFRGPIINLSVKVMGAA